MLICTPCIIFSAFALQLKSLEEAFQVEVPSAESSESESDHDELSADASKQVKFCPQVNHFTLFFSPAFFCLKRPANSNSVANSSPSTISFFAGIH